MKIVVIGGSGLIGKKLVANLRRQGHDVLAASPSSGVNAVTGEGLAEALTGADIVVDVANSPSFEDKPVLEFFEKSGRNLLPAEAAVGVRHHIALSVVGTERLLASGYFRAQGGHLRSRPLLRHRADRPQPHAGQQCAARDDAFRRLAPPRRIARVGRQGDFVWP